MHSPAKARSAFAGLALLTWLLAACSADPPEGVFFCRLDSDCPRGQACAPDQLCRASGRRDQGGTGSSAEPSNTGEGGTQTDPGAEQGAEAGSESNPALDGAVSRDASGPEPSTAPDPRSDASAPGLDANEARLDATSDTGARVEAGSQGGALGASCSARSDCGSAAGCVDGVCCDVASCGTCQRCGASGRCETIASGTDIDSCGGQCSAGRCGLPNGVNCTATGTPCHSGNCVDGVCCDTSCDQACRSCTVTDSIGRCASISGVDDPGSCEGARSCASGQCATVDAQSLEIGSANYFGTMNMGWLRLAQVLTVPMAGQLVAVHLDILCLSSADRFSVGVFGVGSDGAPSTTRLATLTRDMTPRDPRTPPPMAMTTQLIAFLPSPSLRVNAGDRIAIVAEAPNNTEGCLFRGARLDAFSGGTGYGQHAPDMTWSRMTEDFTFRLLVVH